MKTMILQNGDMVIQIPKEEKEQQLQHLDSLIPIDQSQYDEITVLLDMVEERKPRPKLTLIKGEKP